MNFKEMFLGESEILNEAFKSSILKKLVKMNGFDYKKRDLVDIIEKFSKVKFRMSEIEDGKHVYQGDIQAGKDAMKKGALVFWIVKNGKELKFKEDDLTVENNTILFVTTGKDVIGETRKYGKKLGMIDWISKIPSKRELISHCDEVIVINTEASNKDYDVIKMREKRHEMKQGSWLFKTDAEFRAENQKRYKELLSNKHADMDVMEIVKEIKNKSDMIVNKFFQNPSFSKKGWEMIVNDKAKDWFNGEIRTMSDLLRFLDESYRCAGELNQAKNRKAMFNKTHIEKQRKEYLEAHGNLDGFVEKVDDDNWYSEEVNVKTLELRKYKKTIDKALKSVMNMSEETVGFSDYFSKIKLDEKFDVNAFLKASPELQLGKINQILKKLDSLIFIKTKDGKHYYIDINGDSKALKKAQSELEKSEIPAKLEKLNGVNTLVIL